MFFLVPVDLTLHGRWILAISQDHARIAGSGHDCEFLLLVFPVLFWSLFFSLVLLPVWGFPSCTIVCLALVCYTCSFSLCHSCKLRYPLHLVSVLSFSCVASSAFVHFVSGSVSCVVSCVLPSCLFWIIYNTILPACLWTLFVVSLVIKFLQLCMWVQASLIPWQIRDRSHIARKSILSGFD